MSLISYCFVTKNSFTRYIMKANWAARSNVTFH